MEAVSEITPLKLITEQTGDVMIRVKVHITWRKTYWKNPNSASSFEMVFVDSEGTKIRATLDKSVMTYFGSTFKEGNYYEVGSFRVGKDNDDVPLLDHQFKIHLLRGSRVRTTQAFDIQKDVFRVVNYADINQSLLKEDEIFDVVGKLVELKELRVTRSKGIETKCIEFQLQDLSGENIKCALWGQHASHLHEFVSALDDTFKNNVVMLIHNCRLKVWDDAPQVSNMLWGCRVYLNEAVAPVEQYKSLMVDTQMDPGVNQLTPTAINAGMKITTNVDRFTAPTPYLIEDALAISKPTTFVMLGRVLEIVKTEGWFGYKCNKCNGKVINRFDVDSESTMLECVQCEVVESYSPRIRLTLRVGDKSGNCYCVLFDGQLASMLNKSVNWLNKCAKSCADPSDYPPEVQQLENKKFAFMFNINSKNLEYINSGFTVNDVTNEDDVIEALEEKFKNKQSNDEFNDPTAFHSTPLNTFKVPKIEPASSSEVSVSTWTPGSSGQKRKSESPLEDEANETPTSGATKAIEDLKIPRLADF
ncbi:uncharacterized protein [Rutidosis leptorrhynchoides]|uniref:uncharacterized protein n=1 Tax=Rutidosis leptorrhynchoides TaxID=125765 RepID=UPI003A997D8C